MFFWKTRIFAILIFCFSMVSGFSQALAGGPTVEELLATGNKILEHLPQEKREMVMGLSLELTRQYVIRKQLSETLETAPKESIEYSEANEKINAIDTVIPTLLESLSKALIRNELGPEAAAENETLAEFEARCVGSESEDFEVEGESLLVDGEPRRQDRVCSTGRMIGSACYAGALALCVVGGQVIGNEWVKASLFATGAAIVYSSSGIIGNRIPLPQSIQGFGNIALRSIIGALLVFPGNLLGYKTVQIALAPGSTVNIVATNSLLVFMNELFSTIGALVFLDQPASWPVWVGIAAFGGVAGMQAWHAVNNPVVH